MTAHPYRDQPDYAFWSRAVSGRDAAALDPVVKAKFRLGRGDRVATAGSCFAQHIARFLTTSGFHYLVTEDAHPFASRESARRHGYGDFTARFGNIYTARQLVQLFDRAYGRFEPADDVWSGPNGRFVDPFRPRVEPGGFPTREALLADRRRHLACVRAMFETLDVFVFTLGLTEAWISREDGACYPLCPGVAGGRYDAARHGFVNFGAAEVRADLEGFLARLDEVNPGARVILTVSPVPLVATAEDRHVLVSTTYSKAVLRVAAEEAAAASPRVAYFPSYEIVAGTATRGAYFAEDGREVLEDGVEHVMRLFIGHYGSEAPRGAGPSEPSEADRMREDLARMERLVRVNCDEVALEA